MHEPSSFRPIAFAFLLALPVAVASRALAGDPPPPPLPQPTPTPAPRPMPAPPVNPSAVPPPMDAAAAERFAAGTRYFDEAIRYVARGGTLGGTRDMSAHMEVVMDLPEQGHQEGEETVWYSTPDKMRTELVHLTRTTTKILAGDQAWAVDDSGKAHRLHATPGAEKDLAQLKEDLMRIRDLLGFVTLEGLKGPGVRFEFVGAVGGSGVYVGDWLKVIRTGSDGRHMTFWLAREKDAQGADHATWPGVVRVEGDVAANLYTEDWILSNWDSPSAQRRAFRYPFKIEAYRFPADPEKAKAERAAKPIQPFMKAFVDDIQVNAGVDAARFEPPQTPAGR